MIPIRFCLSLLLLILSCLPCADAAGDNHTQLSATTGHQDRQHHDLCSPFCLCQCCGVQVLNVSPALAFEVAVLFSNDSKHNLTYHFHLVSMFHGSIWQPPQLC